MIAGTDYKRAAGVFEQRPAPTRPMDASTGQMLRLGWALAGVAPLPKLELGRHLAEALMHACPGGGAAVQIARLDAGGRWILESQGVAGRLASLGEGPSWPARLPWPGVISWSTEPSHVVQRVARGERSLLPLESRCDRVNLRLGLAGMAFAGPPGSLILTAQLAHPHVMHAQSLASLFTPVLPWMLRIVRTALDDWEGQAKRAWLTTRESEVLDHLVEGASVVEIARALDRSHYTVHDHVKSLHRKLGVRSRAALVRCATSGVAPPEQFSESCLDAAGNLH